MMSAVERLFRRDPRLKFWLVCVAVFVAVSTAVRLGLGGWLVVSGGPWVPLVFRAFPVGLIEDLATGILLGLPFLGGLYLFSIVWRTWPGRWLGHILLLTFIGILLFAATAEFFFWNEFDSRFNGIAVNYLIFPREVIGNIRESFDERLILPPIAVSALVLYWPLRRALRDALAAPHTRGVRRRVALVAVLLLAFALPTAYWGPGWPGASRQVNEIADNGLRSLFHAFLTNDADYDGHYAGMPESEALPLLRGLVAQDNTTFIMPASTRSVMRHVDNGSAAKRLNVVLVINESFGSTYVDILDNQRSESISPNIDRLAQDGLLFTNIYATGDRTVRGLEALLTSFAPIPGISTARRSGSEGMDSLPSLLKQFGYTSAFLYAGDKRFDNMGHFWSTIGFDHVWDQGDFSEDGFSTVWGYADEVLYSEAMARMDALTGAGAPTFLTMLTVSNHRPYTYPAGHIAKDPAKRRREYAAAYADWAYGDFIARARTKPWFNDTVFIFIGDHGPKINGAAHVPVEGFRVPLLFYAPKHIAPAQIATLGSSLDMGPTLLGLLGLNYDSPFFGVDLRRIPEGGGRIAMAHNFSVAFGKRDHVVVLEPNGTARGYSFTPGREALHRTEAVDPETLRAAIAQTQTAHHMFYAHEYHDFQIVH